MTRKQGHQEERRENDRQTVLKINESRKTHSFCRFYDNNHSGWKEPMDEKRNEARHFAYSI